MNDDFDVFLCHKSSDQEAVRALADTLEQRQLRVWLAERELIPGRPRQEQLEAAITSARTVAVLVGRDGQEPWQEAQTRVALSLGVDRGKPVIPVLLPGAAAEPELPLFLQAYHWVDFRGGFEATGLDRLEWGISGQKPGSAGASAAPKVTPLAPAQPPRELVGRVYHLGENGEKIVEKDVAVNMEPSGVATTTNNQGIFRLPLAAYLRANDKVTLSVGKEDWRIRYPLDGELRIPAEPLRHVEPIELLPAGSKLFWTHDRIEKFIGDALRNSGQQEVAKAEDPKVDFSRAIRDWAGRYGLSVESAQAEIEKWIADVKKASGSDERQLGLAAFAEQQFEKAAGHFGAAAAANTAELAQIEKDEATLAAKKKKIRRAAVSNFWDQGLAHWSALRFGESIEAFRSALEYVSRQADDQDWAALQNNLGLALQEQGIRTSGEASTRLLGEAVAAYRRALEVYTREQLPQAWAGIQNNLGNAFQAQGIRTSGEVSTRLLGEAVAAYRCALEVYTREQLPQNWAMTQNNLGLALQEQGRRASGEASNSLLGEAIAAYRRALGVRTREQLPQDWAATQNNLGLALQEQAIRTSGEASTRLLGEGVAAYRRALEVRTREQLPQDWAATQNNLGIALEAQGSRTSGEASTRLLGEAVAAYRRALKVRTREQLPQAWAMTQNNLGGALQEQGIRASGEASTRLLGEAVAAYRSALEVHTREQLPQDWAMTQNNLGGALRAQGVRTSGEASPRLLGEAVAAYRRALEVYTREQLPGLWLVSRRNEGIALEALGHFAKAAVAYREVLELDSENSALVHALLSLYTDRIHDAAAALALARNWLERHSDDGWVQLRLSGLLFATGGYTSCNAVSSVWANKVADNVALWSVQAGYNVAALLAQDQAGPSLAKLEQLIAKIAEQAADFKTRWTFKGTLYFVQHEPELPHREVLIALFEALQAADRDAMLSGLRRVRELVAVVPRASPAGWVSRL